MENREKDAVQGVQGLVYREGLIFEQSAAGRVGYSLPEAEVPEVPVETVIPAHLLRDEIAGFPRSQNSTSCGISRGYRSGTMPSTWAHSHSGRVR